MKLARKIFCFIFAVIFFISSSVIAQSDITIKEVRIKNSKSVSKDTILAKIKTSKGQVFSRSVLNDDLKRLYALGYFTDVSIDVEETPEGIIVNIIVEEKPVINRLVFEGNKKISSGKIKKVIVTKDGDLLNYTTLSRDLQSIKNLYKEKGFERVSITHKIEQDTEAEGSIVVISIEENVRDIVVAVSLEGNKSIKSKDLFKIIATKPKKWFWQKGYFRQDNLEQDIQRLQMYYQDKGFLDVKVSHEITYDDKGMTITFIINEGQQYKTGTIDIKGEALVFDQEKLHATLKMKQGDPFRHAALREDLELLKDLYYEQGYMNVAIDIDRNMNLEKNTIDIIYTIVPGSVVYVGKIEIKGNHKTKDVVIRRELRIYPGDKFNGKSIRRSKERLYNLGFFEDIFWSMEETYDKNIKDILITVKESKTGEFAFGGGYSSVDSFVGFAQITQRNFDLFSFPSFTGDGQNLAIKVTMGSVRRDYDISWTEPWIMDHPISFGFDLYSRTHARESDLGYGYEEKRTGGDVRIGKEFTEQIRGDLMYTLEEVKISDLDSNATSDLKDEEGKNWLSKIMVAAAYDTRDNIYAPKKGFISQVIFENAGGPIGFDKDFIKTYLMCAYYHTFFDIVTLEMKARTGWINPTFNTKKTPIYERFFAGGATSIRGYKERKVGPRDAGSGEPIGGNSMFIGNIEATFPIYENLIKGAVFYDIGSVWRGAGDYFNGSFKSGLGCGVRVKTPIGPVKVDMGYPLNENQSDKKRLEFYFSMTHGF